MSDIPERHTSLRLLSDPSEAADASDFIGNMCQDLVLIAERMRCRDLAYILGMAALEAQTVSRRHRAESTKNESVPDKSRCCLPRNDR